MPRPIRCTYRVQLHRGCGFDDVAALADYFGDLGVSHVYLSPCLQAVPGSVHGYDVIDPTRVDSERGGAEGFARLTQALQARGLGLVVDVVPNHLAISSPNNHWWWDVLENGPASRYASYFDVDWDPPESKLRNLVLVPILADHYGRELEGGAIRVGRDGGAFTIHYHDHVLPVAPRTLDQLLSLAAARCGSQDLAAIADAYAALPMATSTDHPSVLRRHRGKEWLATQLRQLCAADMAVARAVDDVLAGLNAEPDALHALLERQNYRLAFWRTAERDLGYRRFFDINSLIGLHVEDDVVFAETHALILSWVTEGMVDGLRIDHIDGLRDPREYLVRLRRAVPGTWTVVEKILQSDELPRRTWPVDGTTGYEFLQLVGGLFVDPNGERPLTALYEEICGATSDYRSLVRDKKRQVMQQALASDVNRLTALLVAVCERHRRRRDYTRHELHEALREVIACFPVYRTYVRSEATEIANEDREHVAVAVATAKVSRPDLDAALFDFLGDLLTLHVRGVLETEFVMRFQQLTGPVMAKGVEDTAFYCFHRFVALNEVGGDPSRFGVDVETFHASCRAAQHDWPRAMLTTSTHDTKRSEDVRARLAVISEIPDAWSAAVRGWLRRNERHRREGWPDRGIEYLFYQTLIGAWPIEADRAVAYLLKAAREAKTHTSWIRPLPEYENAVEHFVRATLADAEFRHDVATFVGPLVIPGRVNSVAQTLIKLTAPGIPDLYQGTELWDLSLVDPDNRRPVDFTRRAALLPSLASMRAEVMWTCGDEGLPKLWVTRQALAVRQRQPQWFGEDAEYEPLNAAGYRRGHVVAFSRAGAVVTVAPRLGLSVGDEWNDTAIELPSGQWHNWLTGDSVRGGTVRMADLLARFPVALLVRENVA